MHWVRLPPFELATKHGPVSSIDSKHRRLERRCHGITRSEFRHLCRSTIGERMVQPTFLRTYDDARCRGRTLTKQGLGEKTASHDCMLEVFCLDPEYRQHPVAGARSKHGTAPNFRAAHPDEGAPVSCTEEAYDPRTQRTLRIHK